MEREARKRWPEVPLRVVLIVPLLVQVALAVGLTSWLSLTQGQRALDEVVDRLRNEINRRVHAYLTSYLETAHLVNGFNARAIELGELDARDPTALGRGFWRQLQHFDTLAFIFYGSAAGGAAGAGRRAGGQLTVDATEVDSQSGLLPGLRSEWSATATGGRGELLEARGGFDGRKRPWFLAAEEAGGPAWSGVFPLFAGNELAIAASQPIYSEGGELRGVVAVDLLLSGIDVFLRDLDIGKTGSAFILERSGLLVATSSGERLLVRAPDGTSLERRQALDSPTPLVADTTWDLAEEYGNLEWIDVDRQLTVNHGGERRYVQVTPLIDGRGIDWLIVTVVPEADFLAPLEESRRRTVWLSLLAFLVATLLGLYTSRFLAGPILRLGEASAGLAAGDRTRRVEVQGVAELSDLARTFNRMAGELEDVFGELETRVTERTAELQDAKDAADAANQAKSRFLANISHEIRTPLAAMLGYADLLADRSLEEGAAEDLEILRHEGRHLQQLLSDLLDLSRIEAGHLELSIRSTELADLLAQLRSIFEPLAREKGLRLEFVTPGLLPWRFESDPLRLRQILSNLLSNAIRYTDRGEIILRVRSDSAPEGEAEEASRTALHFEVEDTGPGIAAADQERLFRPFTRLAPGDAERRQGFGLGLSIVHQLVEKLGGAIVLESQRGRGACFTVSLPVTACGGWAARRPEAVPARRDDRLAALPALAGRVLVAEDSGPLRRLCRLRLEGWGLRCATVVNGLEAVERASAEGFDVILMDWHMDEMDGLEATAMLRRQGIETPILALTAAALAGDRARCLAAGCDEVLSKPIDFKELHAALAAFLGGGTEDPELAALVVELLHRLPAQLGTLREALASDSWPVFDRTVHRLVGTAGTYGLDDIFRAAEALEAAGQARDAAAARRGLELLAATVSDALESKDDQGTP